MHWVIQENLYNEEGFQGLINALERLRLPHSVHKVIPFTSTLVPEVDVPEGTPIIVMGATTMCRIAQERGWEPGAYFNDNYDYEVHRETPWGQHMLNYAAFVCEFRHVSESICMEVADGGVFFTRPTHDIKTYAGTVMEWAEFAEWQHRVVGLKEDNGSSLNGDTRVLVSAPQNIYAEWRLYLVNGVVVAGSCYRRGGRLVKDPSVDEDVAAFALERASEWGPSEAYVMDIARVSTGLKIIEAGCMNAAGYYTADIGRVVEAVEALEAAKSLSAETAKASMRVGLNKWMSGNEKICSRLEGRPYDQCRVDAAVEDLMGTPWGTPPEERKPEC